MNLVEVNYYCPCCGYSGLNSRPYENSPNPPYNLKIVQPPYMDQWGFPSYEVCVCCGFEFGNDDHGMSVNVSFEEYLTDWIQSGCVWFHPDEKPKDWDLDKQLRAAGLSRPG